VGYKSGSAWIPDNPWIGNIRCIAHGADEKAILFCASTEGCEKCHLSNLPIPIEYSAIQQIDVLKILIGFKLGK